MHSLGLETVASCYPHDLQEFTATFLLNKMNKQRNVSWHSRPSIIWPNSINPPFFVTLSKHDSCRSFLPLFPRYTVDLKSLFVLTLHVPCHLFSHLRFHSFIHSIAYSVPHPVAHLWTSHVLSARHCTEAPGDRCVNGALQILCATVGP